MPDETEGLLNQAKLLAETLNRLRARQAIETDPSLEFKYEIQIAELEKERQGVMASLRQQPSYSLYQELLRLDYQKQSVQYEMTLQANRPALFIVRGPEGHGQKWLLHRFLSKWNLSPLHVNIVGRTSISGAEGVWNQLRKRFWLAQGATREEIAAKVCGYWSTRDFAIIVHAIGATSEESVNVMIEDFWKPLTGLIAARTPQPDRRLLMFLVDDNGGSLSWQIAGVDQWNEQWNPQQPVRLEILKCFDHQLVSQWVGTSADLPPKLRADADEAANQILNQSEGIPEEVLIRICQICDANLEFFEGKIY